MSLEGLGLAGLLAAVLVLPFSVRHVEEELEAFLLVMGALAVTISGQWSGALLHSALMEPLPLSLAVLGAGALFLSGRSGLRSWIRGRWQGWGPGASSVALVAGLGLLSCVLTGLVAALMLAEALDALRLPRRAEVRLAVLACFAIGLGSALTPLGGPLAAIAVGRLRGEPYHADAFFLLRLLGPWVLGLTALLAVFALRWGWGVQAGEAHRAHVEPHAWGALGLRGLRAYGFVLGLVLLGQGFQPLAERWLPALPGWALFWANSSSALLDNATLVAAELGPRVPPDRLRWLLLGLLLSGGMLIPGNIPNILCAAQRRIRPKEWARVGVPLGLALMVLVHLVLWAWGR